MFKELNPLTYKCGGYCRDFILGLRPLDVDYVIEKTSVEQFESVFPEAKRVGLSFPVYLIDGHEVALARTETKITGLKSFFVGSIALQANAYTMFDVKPGVSIEEDLARRDFTINSIAENIVTRSIVDPYGGVEDIHKKILRAVNLDAFNEDPLRIYRGCRFAARFGFKFDDDTWSLMIANAVGLRDITPDRVYIELKKVYEQCDRPSNFFSYLYALDALKYHFKPLDCMTRISAGPSEYHHGKTAFDHACDSFDRAKLYCYPFDVALAALLHDTGKGVSKKAVEGADQHHYKHELMSYAINKQFVKQHRFTVKQNELIVLAGRWHMYFHILEKVKQPVKLIRFYKKIKKYAEEMMFVSNCDHGLNEAQLMIFVNLKTTFESTKINIPEGMKDTEKIVNYVEQCYVSRYKELVNGN